MNRQGLMLKTSPLYYLILFLPFIQIWANAPSTKQLTTVSPDIPQVSSKNRRSSAPQRSSLTPSSQNNTMNLDNQSSEPTKHAFGIGLGETFLTGDLSKYGEDAITFDFFYSYEASHSFDLFLNFHHSKHKAHNKLGPYQHQFTKAEGLAIAIKGKLYEFDSFAPYILGGLGFYRPQIRSVGKDGNLSISQSKTAFGVHAGAGMDLKLNERFSIGLLAHYHNPFNIDLQQAKKVTGSYFKLLITTMFTI